MFFSRCGAGNAVELGVDAQVLFDGEIGVAGEGLGNDADHAADGIGILGDIVAGDDGACHAVTGMSVVIMRMSVLFPAPLGPSRPKISPSAT